MGYFRLGSRLPPRSGGGSVSCGGGDATASGFVRDKLGFAADEKQRAILDSTARRGILNCSRQWGKSTVLAAKAVHHVWTTRDGLALVASPTERQSRLFLRRCAGFLHKLGIARRGDGDNRASLLLPNGGRIIALPGEEENVRGFSDVTMILIDEAAVVPDELCLALESMLVVTDGPYWAMSTPRGCDGYFYDAWHRQEGWEKHTATALDAPWIRRDVIERHRRTMPGWYFRQEYFCEFAKHDDAWFDRETVLAAISTEEKTV